MNTPTPTVRRSTNRHYVEDHTFDEYDYLMALEAGDSVGTLVREWRPGDPIRVAR
jgi:hypothetical protein